MYMRMYLLSTCSYCSKVSKTQGSFFLTIMIFLSSRCAMMSAVTLKAAQKKRPVGPQRASRPLTLPKEKTAPMATMLLLLLKPGCRTTAAGDMGPEAGSPHPGGSSFTSPRALFVLRQARLTPTFTPNLWSHDTESESAGLRQTDRWHGHWHLLRRAL